MNTVRFSSTMTKFNVNVKNEDIFVTFQLKVVEDSTTRGLPQQFKAQIDLSDVFQSLAVNDVWDKVNIPVNEYRMKYKVTFDSQVFEAKLENIAASIKKDKSGVPFTEYVMTFYKELDKEQDTALSLYLKRKDENPETGKKEITWFETVLEEI